MPGPTTYGGVTVNQSEKLQLETQPISEFVSFVPNGNGFTMKYKYPEQGSYTPEGSTTPVTFNIRENMNILNKHFANMVTEGEKPFTYSTAKSNNVVDFVSSLDSRQITYNPDLVLDAMNIPENKRDDFKHFLAAMGSTLFTIGDAFENNVGKLLKYQNILNAHVEHPENELLQNTEATLRNSYPEYLRQLDDLSNMANIDPANETDVLLNLDCKASAGLNFRIAELVNNKRVAEGKEPLANIANHEILFVEQQQDENHMRGFDMHYCFTSTVKLGAEDKVVSIEMTAPAVDKIFFRDENGVAATGIYDTLDELDQFHADRNMITITREQAKINEGIVGGRLHPKDPNGKDLAPFPHNGLSLEGIEKFADIEMYPHVNEQAVTAPVNEAHEDIVRVNNQSGNIYEFSHQLAAGTDYPTLCDKIKELSGSTVEASAIARNEEAGGLRVYDENLNPIDFSNRTNLQTKMLNGMYVFKEGETEPHRMTFDANGNLTYNTKAEPLSEPPQTVPRPGGITRFFNSIVKALGGSGFESCNRYDKFVKDSEQYNKMKGIVTDRSKKIMAQAQNARSRQTIAEEYQNSQNAYTRMAQKDGLSADVKRSFEQGARGFEKIGTSNNIRSFSEPNDTTLARIALANALAKERVMVANNPRVQPQLEDFLNREGYENTLRAFNRLPSIVAAKENLSPATLRRTVTSKGHYISKNVAAEFHRAQQSQQPRPERNVNGPAGRSN